MYILKNAWISITRNKGRNILIAIIVTVIAAASAVTLSIKHSADQIVKSYEDKYQIEATIGMNRKNLQGFMKNNMEPSNDDSVSTQENRINMFNNMDSLTIEEINNYGTSEYVSSYYYIYEISMNADGIEKATSTLTKKTTTTTEGPGKNFGGRVETKTEFIGGDEGDFKLKGYSSYESMIEFLNGNYKIQEGGTAITDFDSNECIISSELAELNELEVGKTIKLVNPKDEDLTYKVKIVGIYEDSSEDSNDMTKMFSNSANQIIVSSKTVEKIVEDDDDSLRVTVTPTFVLTSAKVIEDFTKEVEEKGLAEYLTVTTNYEEVNASTKSIQNVKTFAGTFLTITLIIGGIVLLVLNMINIRERKYEIGVLRTIGMKKITVISQFVLELLIVSIVGLALGAGIGAATSVNVANSLLESEINNASEEVENINENFGFGGGMPGGGGPSGMPGGFSRGDKLNGISQIEQVDNINAAMDFTVLLELFGIGLLLTIISSLSACISISRFQPLQILKERS